MAVNIHITIIELNALHTKRQNLFQELDAVIDRKSGSAGMPRPISYAVFCLKKKTPRAAGRARGRSRVDAACRSAAARTRRPDAPSSRMQLVQRSRCVGRGHSLRPPPASAGARPAPGARRIRFFFKNPSTPYLYTLSLHDALPI